MPSIGDLTPDPKNARRHTPRNVGMIESSIQRDGFGRSILLASDGTIIAGNATVDAAGSAGLDDVIVVESDGTKVVAVKRTDVAADSPAFHRLAVADNRTAELAEWDAAILTGLMDDGLVERAAFWHDDEWETLKRLTAEPVVGLTDPDDVPEPPAVPITQPGDLWLLGRHRLLCGDATDAGDVGRLLDGAIPGAIMTDPPYAFGLASTSKMDEKSGGWHDMMNNASWFASLYAAWHRLVRSGPVWVFGNWRTLPILMRAAFDSGVGLDSVMVWYKDWIGPGGNKGLRPTYELVAFTALGDYAIPDRGVEDFVRVGWSSHKPTGHGAEKPAELMAHLLSVSARDTVFDPFLGSGTTLIAAEQTGRICFGTDLEPTYCDVAVRRWEQFTGNTAERVPAETAP